MSDRVKNLTEVVDERLIKFDLIERQRFLWGLKKRWCMECGKPAAENGRCMCVRWEPINERLMERTDTGPQATPGPPQG